MDALSDVYNSYYYQALGYLTGRSDESYRRGDSKTSRFWENSKEWCDFYAAYRVRCFTNKHEPISMPLSYDTFLAMELPQIHNAQATTPCEVANG